MQKTNFLYEILIHDDASTDNTANIIRSYEKKYPNIIKPIYQKVNQYSKGISVGITFQYPRIKGEYVAICEGDDYWIDPNKLQKQVDALEKNPTCDVCAHTAVVVNAKTKKVIKKIEPSKKNIVFSAGEVIRGDGGFVATNSLMFRRAVLTNLSEFCKFYDIDYSLQIQGALRGGMLFLAENMSAYRYLANGSWTARMRKNKETAINNYVKIIEMLKMVDKHTDGKYTQIISERIRLNEFNKLQFENDYKTIIKEFKDLLEKESIQDQMKIYVKAKFPCLVYLNEWKKKCL